MNRKKLLFIVAAGILLRLVFAYCFTYSSDFQKILIHVKSIATTGDFFQGMKIMFRIEDNPQLYGKIWYQIAGIWVLLLSKLGLISFSGITLGNALQPFQQFLVKLIQLPYDLFILFFMYRIAARLKIKNVLLVCLFWAFNPLWMYIAYAMFQADLAVMAFVMGAIAVALGEKRSDALAMILISFGFIIKLMPLLLVPVFLLYLHRSWKKTVVNVALFVLFSFLLLQPWGRDFVFMRRFNFNSYEAVSLFHEQWNGASEFALMYFGLFAYFWVNRSPMRKNGFQFLVAVTLTVLSVLLGETYVLLYPQYMMWLMPLAVLLVAGVSELLPLIFLPFFGFIVIAIQNTSMMTGAFTDWLGNRSYIELAKYFGRFYHEKILLVGLRTSFVALAFLSAYLSFRALAKKKPLLDRAYAVFAERWGTFLILLAYNSYFLFLLVDWAVQRTVK